MTLVGEHTIIIKQQRQHQQQNQTKKISLLQKKKPLHTSSLIILVVVSLNLLNFFIKQQPTLFIKADEHHPASLLRPRGADRHEHKQQKNESTESIEKNLERDDYNDEYNDNENDDDDDDDDGNNDNDDDVVVLPNDEFYNNNENNSNFENENEHEQTAQIIDIPAASIETISIDNQQQYQQQQNKWPLPPVSSPSIIQETKKRIELEQQKYDEINFQLCQDVLGIETILTLETFHYYDYMKVLSLSNILLDDDELPTVEELPLIPVRGLAASRNIEVGEVVIRIPFTSLFTVSNLIDEDPVLSNVLGPTQRLAYGWGQKNNHDTTKQKKERNFNNDDTIIEHDDIIDQTEVIEEEHNDEEDVMYELPLLAIALLYHCQLGTASALYPYVQILTENNPMDQIPFLWKDERLNRDAPEGVHSISNSIRMDIDEWYHTLVVELIHQHPDIFANPMIDEDGGENNDNINNDNGDNNERNIDATDPPLPGEWMFSLKRFRWAFAVVNSRHWHLPIPPFVSEVWIDENGEITPLQNNNDNIQHAEEEDEEEEEEDLHSHVFQEPPPAAMPTDEWVKEQEEEEVQEYLMEQKQQEKIDQEGQRILEEWRTRNSFLFLAPVADMLNYGPPCTRGVYNQEEQTFDILATCKFNQGQEVTFWYSDACEDMIVSNYGFTHPMVPPCPTMEDLRQESQLWKSRAERLERELILLYNELDRLEEELDETLTELDNCNNNNNKDSNDSKGHNTKNEAAVPMVPPSTVLQQPTPRRSQIAKYPSRTKPQDQPNRIVNTGWYSASSQDSNGIRGSEFDDDDDDDDNDNDIIDYDSGDDNNDNDGSSNSKDRTNRKDLSKKRQHGIRKMFHQNRKSDRGL